jgi:hypothetical protein
VLLKREGWACNRKRVQRLWRDEGLHVPRRKRRRRKAARTPSSVTATRPDQVWALDYIFDATADGRPIKILNITDEYTREALACLAGPLDQRRPDRQHPREPRRDPRAHTGPHPLRQRPRTRGRNTPRLVPLSRHQSQLHRTRRTLAKPLRRIVQRPPTTRTARTRVLQQPLRSPDPARRLAARVQQLPPTPIPQLPNPSSIRPPLACSPPTRTLITSGPKNGVTSEPIEPGTGTVAGRHSGSTSAATGSWDRVREH